MVGRVEGVAEEVAEAFAGFPEPQCHALNSSWLSAVRLLPGAQQCIAWGMPTLRADGDLVISMQGFAKHNSVFPGPVVIDRLAAELAGTTVTKGTIHFERDKPMHRPLQRKILRACLTELNAGYPRANGVYKEYYDNGYLKVRGKVKSGEHHGLWEFFRKDGTIKRSGRFNAGRQVGTWITYDSAGHPHKETDFGRSQRRPS